MPSDGAGMPGQPGIRPWMDDWGFQKDNTAHTEMSPGATHPQMIKRV